MKHHRHSVIKIARPADWQPSSPTDIPPAIIEIPRIDLGRAAAEARRLNEAELAKGEAGRFWFLPVKAFAGLRSLRRGSSPDRSAAVESVPLFVVVVANSNGRRVTDVSMHEDYARQWANNFNSLSECRGDPRAEVFKVAIELPPAKNDGGAKIRIG